MPLKMFTDLIVNFRDLQVIRNNFPIETILKYIRDYVGRITKFYFEFQGVLNFFNGDSVQLAIKVLVFL
jgi:hypothetical protein